MKSAAERWIVTRLGEVGAGEAAVRVIAAGGSIVDQAADKALLIEACAETIERLQRALPTAVITPERLL